MQLEPRIVGMVRMSCYVPFAFNAPMSENVKRFLLFFVLVLGLFVGSCKKEEPTQPPPSKPIILSDFSSAKVCQSCHPDQYRQWNASRHHFSSNNPIWMLANNGLQSSMGGKLGSTCWPCHSPIGYLTGNTLPTFQLSDLNGLIREGDNCDVCHFMRAPHTTTNGPIRYHIEPGKARLGPMLDPMATTGHENGYDASFATSEMCRECHDLIVNGNPVEITNTELQISPWAVIGMQCQDCHMSTYTGRAAIDAPIRNNLHRHDFIPVSVPLTDFPDKDLQRAGADSLLRLSLSMLLTAPTSAHAGDSVSVSALVYNDKTAHNVPTSVFFFRQMWLEVTVFNGKDTVYRSGHLDSNGDLMESHSSVCPNADKDLALFSGTLYKHGVETDIVEMDSMVNNSIAAFGAKTANYRFKIPRAGAWDVRIRLLFRPYGPYLLRSVGAEQYLPELRISEMINREAIIDVR